MLGSDRMGLTCYVDAGALYCVATALSIATLLVTPGCPSVFTRRPASLSRRRYPPNLGRAPLEAQNGSAPSLCADVGRVKLASRVQAVWHPLFVHTATTCRGLATRGRTSVVVSLAVRRGLLVVVAVQHGAVPPRRCPTRASSFRAALERSRHRVVGDRTTTREGNDQPDYAAEY